MSIRKPSAEQLSKFKNTPRDGDSQLTTGFGAPVSTKTAIQTVGERGPALLQDVQFLDEMSHFDRERIPERVVHAKGAGAFGYFEVTHDITEYCAAGLFKSIGKRTPIAVRFSTFGGESGSADTVRDPRGFAIKFYTDEGVWDLVGNNTPIFFVRDPSVFPSFVHTQKRNPATHLKDADMFWDFLSLRPESVHQVMILFGDRGTPNGYRYMNGYGGHAFKSTNESGESRYVKFHYKTDQGIDNLSADRAEELTSTDPDYSGRDLYDAIENKKYPTWTLYIQVMSFEQAETCKFNPFDVTKVWPQSENPLIPVGKICLNRNPKNYFAEVEQLAFSPAHMVPGIEPSPDKTLQGRLFAYSDAHRHRLGANYLQLPVNCPYTNLVKNYQRDGPQCYTGNQEDGPNYYPNSFNGPIELRNVPEAKQFIFGDVDRVDSGDEDNFSQPAVFWEKVLDEGAKTRLVDNIVGHLKNAADFIQDRTVNVFAKVNADFGNRLRIKLSTYKHQRSNL